MADETQPGVIITKLNNIEKTLDRFETQLNTRTVSFEAFTAYQVLQNEKNATYKEEIGKLKGTQEKVAWAIIMMFIAALGGVVFVSTKL